MARESGLQTQIMNYLKGLATCRVRNNHGDEFSVIGEPDLFVCYRGRFMAIEVKRQGEEPAKKQRYELRKWSEAGAIAFWTDSLETVRQEICKIDQSIQKKG